METVGSGVGGTWLASESESSSDREGLGIEGSSDREGLGRQSKGLSMGVCVGVRQNRDWLRVTQKRLGQ